MKKYSFSFHGRQSGAIGIFYKINQNYTAKSLKEACTMLFVDYEHITMYTLNGKPFKIDSNDLDDPETLKNYKGLGINRK
jgi:hypothetical protein